MHTLFLNEHRCTCGKLLLKGYFFDGVLEIKCDWCGAINRIGSIKVADDPRHYLLIVNKDGCIVNASSSAFHILGYTRDELIGKPITLVDPTAMKELAQKFLGPHSVLCDNNYFILEREHRLKNGRMIPVTIFFKLYHFDEKNIYLLSSARVNNSTNNDEKKFKMHEKEISDEACDFYFDIDRNGNYLYVSPPMKDLFGFYQEKLLGKNYFDCLTANIKAEAQKKFAYYAAYEQTYQTKDSIQVAAEGRIIHRDLYFTANYNDLGKFTGYRVFGWIDKIERTDGLVYN